MHTIQLFVVRVNVHGLIQGICCHTVHPLFIKIVLHVCVERRGEGGGGLLYAGGMNYKCSVETGDHYADKFSCYFTLFSDQLLYVTQTLSYS